MARAKRAKKAKISKKLLIIPGVAVTLGITTFLINANLKTEKIEEVEDKRETYQSTLVKDVFTQNNIKYLPIKLEDTYETITKHDIEREFNNAGIKIEEISSNIICTGTQIKTKNVTYIALVYGDVDGDGEVNILDVQRIITHLLYVGNSNNQLTGIYRMVANVDEEKEDTIDVLDALRIVEFILGRKTVIDSLPTSDIENDKEAPVITLNGEKDITLNVFEEYKELGATVTDNLDPYIESKLRINANNVNMSRPGDYEVTYDVTDASGNVAQRVTRIVHVVDFVEDMHISIYPKQQYVDGETITLENMVAYPIYAYGKEQAEAIDISKIKVEPAVATMGMDTIKIIYENVEKEIQINVTERKPIITLNYDDAENVKIKVGTTYEENATAYDETDGVTLKVNIKGTVDVNTPGKYVITYESEPNSVGKIGTRVRTVEVVDYITEAGVQFEIDSNIFKTKYVDGSEISLDGLKAYANYKAAGRTLLDNSKLKTNIEIVKYDRVNEANNKNKKLVISYEEYDEVDKKLNTYNSDDINNNLNLQIEVVKKFETIEEVQEIGVTKTGNIYDDLWVARIKSGENEEDIEIDKIDISIANPDTDGDNCKATAWVEPVYQKNARDEYVLDEQGNKIVVKGYLDIFFSGVSNRTYDITITPKETTSYTQAKTLDTITTTVSSQINTIELSNFTIEGNETRFKTGGSIIADVVFKHNYNKNHTLEIGNVTIANLQNIQITDESGNNIRGITGVYMQDSEHPATGNAPVKKVRIIADDATYIGTNTGEKIQIKVSAKNGSGQAEKEMNIFAKSNYQTEIGRNDIEKIKLSLKQLTNSEYSDYAVRKPEGSNNYYTLLPIAMYDQYNEDRKILIDDILTEIDVECNKTGVTLAVEGFREDGNPAREDNEVKYIGIAITGGEDELEQAGTTISVKYNNSIVRTFTDVELVRKDITSIAYKEIESVARNYCYEDITIAKVTSGEKQAGLTTAEENMIGCTIEKDGTTITDKTKAYYTVEVQDKVATIKFWAKEAGIYNVTPYIIIDNEKVLVEGKNAVLAEVEENTIVTNVTFNNLGKDYDPNNEAYFGTTRLNINQRNTIEFWHKYTDKSGKPDIRKLGKGVDYNDIQIVPSATYKSYIDENLISDNNIIVPPVDKALVNEVVVNINADILKNGRNVGDSIEIFTLKVKDKDKKVVYSQPIMAELGTEAKADGIKVGDGSRITLYTAKGEMEGNTSIWVDKADKNRRYTLVPIKYIENMGTNNEIEVSSREFILSANKNDKGVSGKIAIIDCVNDREIIDADDEDYIDCCIKVKYFDSNKVEISGSDTTKVKAYIGIAIDDLKEAYLSSTTFDEDSIPQEKWIKFDKIYIYYKIDAGETRRIQLDINSDI